MTGERLQLDLDSLVRLDVFNGLFLVFLALRLSGVIGWSWWWVFAPLYVRLPTVLWMLWLLGVLATVGVLGLIAWVFRRRR